MSALRHRLPDPYFALVVLFSLFAWAPLTYPGFFETHMGLLPPRGLPSLRFLPHVGTAKLVFAVAFIGGGMGVYGWTRGILGRGGALVAALVYVYAPFTLATVYVRGDMADALFIGLLPFALWLARATFKRAAADVAAALIVGGVLLASGGWADRWGAPDDFIAHAVHPFQWFAAGWGNGVSIPGWQDTLPLGLGMASVGLAALGLAVGWPPEMQGPQRGALGAALVFVFLSTSPAVPVWRLLMPLGRLPAWPWQVYLLAGPFLALLAGGALPALLAKRSLEQRAEWALPVRALLIGIVILASMNYLEPRFTTFAPAQEAVIFGNDRLALLEVHAEGTPAPGQTIRVHAVWQAIRPLDFDYTIFIHVVNGNDRVAQQDTQPQGGRRPMTTWRVGELIEDTYEVIVPADAPAANYRLILGVYNWQTGERLPTDKTYDSVEVGTR